MINYIEQNNLIDNVEKYDITFVVTNIYESMNEGFAEDVRQRYPYVYEVNIKQKYGDENLLGTIVEASSSNNPTFGLCYLYKIKKPKSTFLDFNALEKVLKIINIRYKNKHVAMTLMGVDKFEGLGNKDDITNLFNSLLTNVNADVYVFKQDSHLSKWAKALKEGQKLKHDSDKWETFIKNSKKKITKVKNENTTRTNKRPFKTYSVLLNQKRQG